MAERLRSAVDTDKYIINIEYKKIVLLQQDKYMEKSFSKYEKVIIFDSSFNHLIAYEGIVKNVPSPILKKYLVYYSKVVFDNDNKYSVEDSNRIVDSAIMYKSYDDIPINKKKAGFKALFER